MHFIPVDFADPNWISALTSTSYDPAQKTTFLWEGVTRYLSEQAVRDTLSELKAHAAPGSVVIADFYSTNFVTATKTKQVEKLLEMTNEILGFGQDSSHDAEDHLRQFVEAQQLTLGRHQFFGSKRKRGPYIVIAELVIPGSLSSDHAGPRPRHRIFYVIGITPTDGQIIHAHRANAVTRRRDDPSRRLTPEQNHG